MRLAPDAIFDPIPPSPDASGHAEIAPRSDASPDGFFWRQLSAAGLVEVAEKVVGDGDLELDDALALSRASLPLLGKMVDLRPELITLRRDISNSRAASGDTAATDLPLDRVAFPPESPRQTGQALTDWESFCRTLIALRNEFSPGSAAVSWYPILGMPLDRDDGRDGDFTGAEVLRAIALARLILPAEIQVRAPLATLGAKLAQVALHFGASHLGYVALDGQTSGSPLVADPSVLGELMESCLPTSLKEET